jgi:integrase/recombinase XerC
VNLLPLNRDQQVTTLVATFLSSKGTATREAYSRDLMCFQKFLADQLEVQSVHSLLSLTPGDLNFAILKYRDYLCELKLSPATTNRRLGAVRSLFKLARLLGFTTAKIEIANIKSEPYRDTRGPGLAAFKRMVSMATGQDEIKAARDRAILRILFDLALRASELVELDICHVDFEQKRISIKGKGRSQRQFLSLPSTSIEALNDWVGVRGSDPGPLFFNLVRAMNNRKRLSRTGLYQLVRWIGQQVDISTRPHGLRHLSITTACVAAQNNGFGLEEVLDHSRHKSVATLMIYRDRERDTQGAISTLVSNTIHEQED